MLAVWPVVAFEADDTLAKRGHAGRGGPQVGRVVIATPDKDLGQSVVGGRVVQWDRMRAVVRDAAGILAKTGVPPASVSDWFPTGWRRLGDSAAGFPGLPGLGPKTAATLLRRFAHLDAIPDDPSAWGGDVRSAGRPAAVITLAMA